ncbi:hypothetical protein MUP77_04190 [Candidatus Bathyarchaeota archaeon]|nr:hypothetical protein [Candidatus Bathyarchaeota archaeon]
MRQKRYQQSASLGRVGILTTSGKAYLSLVSELKRKKMEYIPLLFREQIPLDVRVVITTKTGENYVQGRRCVLFEEDSDPRKAIEKALMLLLGKTQFREVIIGIDPGKQTGLAVLGDGLILVSGTYVHAKNLVDEITRILPAFPSERVIMRIGKGAEKYSSVLIAAISSKLPTSVEIQVVEEAGTTDNHLLPEAGNMSRNVVSALRIALRQGGLAIRGS